MAFGWVFLDQSGQPAGRSEPFEDRQAAEDWMATGWEDLFAQGYREVALVDLERDRRIYRMGLGPG